MPRRGKDRVPFSDVFPDLAMQVFTTWLAANPVVAGAAPVSLRPRMSDELFWKRLFFGLIVLMLIIALSTFGDYGVTD